MTSLSRLIDDNELYAKLLASIKIKEKIGLRRPLSPIQTAYLIERLVNEEGQDVAESHLPIKTKIISDFIRLKNDLPEQCHDGVTWGTSKDLGVVFSTAHYIATLDKNDDKLLIFSEASKKQLKFKEITEIIRFYKKHDLPLDDVIKKVTNVRPQKITTYLIVISISENSKKKIEEISNKMNKQPEEILSELIQKKLQLSEIDSVQLKGNNIAIALNETEYRNYKKQISKLKLEYDKITEHLVN